MGTTPVAKPQPLAEKKKRHRSPNYPAVGLREAIDRVKKFIAVDGRAGAAPEIAAKHIGYASAHGQAYSVLAALKKFGLVEERDGRVIPTQRAIEIISLPEADQRRAKAIREAALLPPIYVQLIEQYRVTGLPSDETLEGELKAYKGFNPNAVKEFLKAFRETLEFSGLSDFSLLGSESKADEGEIKPAIGDFVQWEHNGILGFPEAKKLIRFSDDGQYAFVEGYTGGLPTSEIIPAETPSSMVPLSSLGRALEPRITQSVGAKMRQDVFSLSEGEVVIHWPTPLSEESIKDLEEWLDLVKRKIGRSKAIPKDSAENPQS